MEPINDNARNEEPGIVNIQRQQLHRVRDQEIRNNMARVKTPVEKLDSIPLLRLDEGICDTLKQEFVQMCIKISYVLVPRNDSYAIRLRNWDLWGPFFMVFVFAFFINNSTQLLVLFFSVFVGAFIVTFNVVALGGRLSFFQSFAILSYCIFPIFLALLIQRLLRFFQIRSNTFTFILMAMAVIWSIVSVSIFIGVNVAENKKLVSVYPAALYYLFIGIILAFS